MIASAAIDTNILIYAHIADYKEHAATRRWLAEFLEHCDSFYLTWQVVYEYVRIVTHPVLHRNPLSAHEALSDLVPYLEHPKMRLLTESKEHAVTASELFKKIPASKGNFIHDCHYAAVLKEHAVKTIVTADNDFLKFKFLDVVNPL